MTQSKRPLKVFLCHAHADRDAVRALYTRLTNDGVDAWLDKEKLLPGQDWELEIKKAVREADVVVVCLSKQFNQAGFRQKEVRLALDTAMEKPEGEIFIIPARLEECDNLESLRKWHWVDLFEVDGYEMLMRALKARAGSIDTTLSFDWKNDKSTLRIMVTGGRVVSKKVEILAIYVGQQVISRGHILMSNGTNGIDKLVAEGARNSCNSRGLSPEKYIQVFRPVKGSLPDFNFGNLHIVGQTYDQRRDYVIEMSDVVILLGGGLGTKDVAIKVQDMNKPLIPIGVGDSTEVAVELWQKMYDDTFITHTLIGRDDLEKIGQNQNFNQVAQNSIILAENLVRRY